MLFALTLFAETDVPNPPKTTIYELAAGSLLFGIVGMALLIVGYFLFDFLCRRIDIQEQLNKGNMAVAVVVAALLLSIAIIAAHVVG
jgi:uncharacterized membrane protein YjfL (UPF0719 family)